MSATGLSTTSSVVDGRGPSEKAIGYLGFKTWTAPIASWGAAAALTSGTLYVTPAWFDAGVPISRFTIVVNPVASGVTLVRFGVYGYASKALLASSADMSSTFNGGTTRFFDFPLSSVWVPPSSGLYWGGLLQVGTTPASVPGTLPASVAQLSNGAFLSANQAGQSDLPVTGNFVGTNRYLHFAAS